ncbi:MAG TPA: glycosyltransferase [Vicinamibacteria bacterium]|nr:glycosyltransferase [Vicinamibacteria bacterium]
MSEPVELSLIIPTFNQRARTLRAVQDASAWLEARFGARAELIVVDDGSDPGEALAEADLPPGVVVVRHPRNLGKGGAVRSGMARTRGEYVAFTDSDLPFSLEPLGDTLARLRDGADIVIGDRLHPDSVASVSVSRARRLSSVVYTWMVQHALGLDYADTQCGYKGYRGAVARDLFGRLRVTSFAFDAELLLRAQAAGYRVSRQPVRLLHNDDSSVRLARHAPRMLIDMVRLAWWRLRRAL